MPFAFILIGEFVYNRALIFAGLSGEPWCGGRIHRRLGIYLVDRFSGGSKRGVGQERRQRDSDAYKKLSRRDHGKTLLQFLVMMISGAERSQLELAPIPPV